MSKLGGLSSWFSRDMWVDSFYFVKTETESRHRNVVFWKTNRTVFLDKDRTMDNVQKQNICNEKSLKSASQLIIISFEQTDTYMVLLFLCFGPTVDIGANRGNARLFADVFSRVHMTHSLSDRRVFHFPIAMYVWLQFRTYGFCQ
jgi:hypothetical protein